MARTKKATAAPAPGRYLDLVRRRPLRPIRDEAGLDAAIAVIDGILDRDALAPDAEDYLDVLSDLVHKCESAHDPIRPTTDAEMLRFLLESNAMTQAALADAAGIAESTISAVLSGRRELNRRHIESLSALFHVSPSVFFRETVAAASDSDPTRIARHS